MPATCCVYSCQVQYSSFTALELVSLELRGSIVDILSVREIGIFSTSARNRNVVLLYHHQWQTQEEKLSKHEKSDGIINTDYKGGAESGEKKSTQESERVRSSLSNLKE